jgi:hypothetical protein
VCSPATLITKEPDFMRRIAAKLIIAVIFSTLFITRADADDTVTVPSKWNVAVLNLKAADGVTAGEAEIISDRLRAELFNTGNVTIMERSEMKQILAEQGFQQSGACSDEACMVQTGKLLGVQQIIAGSIGKVGSMYLINLRMFDVTTGKLVRAISRNLDGIDIIVNNLPAISDDLMNNESASRNGNASGTPGRTKTQPFRPVKKAGSASTIKIGIRFSCDYLSETTVLTLTSRTPAVTLNKAFASVAGGPITMPKVDLVFLLNRFVSFEAGAGYGMWKQVFTADSAHQVYTLTENYGMTSITGSINLSIPVSALRLYTGVVFGYDFLNNTEKATITSGGKPADYAYYLVKAGAGGLSLGLKAGGEFMVSGNLGINLEGVLTSSSFSSAKLDFDPVSSGKTGVAEDLEISVKALGADLGITWYF